MHSHTDNGFEQTDRSRIARKRAIGARAFELIGSAQYSNRSPGKAGVLSGRRRAPKATS
jgi:hypothetical protein